MRALIIKLGAIGDVVMAIPAVEALHQRGFQIDWLCGNAAKPVLEAYPWIRIIPVDDHVLFAGRFLSRFKAAVALWTELVGRHYDLCATLYYDRRYALLTLPVWARRRIRLSHSGRTFSLLAGRHHTDEYARILLGMIDSERPESLAPVRPPSLAEGSPVEGKMRVALVPGGASNTLRQQSLRQWPVDNYVQLARLLLQRGAEVVLLGGKGDAWVLPYFEGMRLDDKIGQLTLMQLVSECDRCNIVVSHDTGPLHIAGLSRAAVIGLFGPTDPAGRVPRRGGALGIWGGHGFACRPCYDGRDFAPCQHNGCMAEISPEFVLEQIDELLDRCARLDKSPFQIVYPRPETSMSSPQISQ